MLFKSLNDDNNPHKPGKIKACGYFYYASGYDLGTEILSFVFRVRLRLQIKSK